MFHTVYIFKRCYKISGSLSIRVCLNKRIIKRIIGIIYRLFSSYLELVVEVSACIIQILIVKYRFVIHKYHLKYLRINHYIGMVEICRELKQSRIVIKISDITHRNRCTCSHIKDFIVKLIRIGCRKLCRNINTCVGCCRSSNLSAVYISFKFNIKCICRSICIRMVHT